MSSVTKMMLAGAVVLCASALATAQDKAIPKETSSDGPPTYTNAQVVAVDVVGRTLVIKNAKGAEERLELDDKLVGFGDIKAGDQVMLTLRAGPGWTRVSSIVKSKAVAAPDIAASSSSRAPAVAVDDSPALAVREAFGAQVANLAGQADRVDHVWNEFRRACNLEGDPAHEGARGWFSIWESSIPADLSGGFCRDLLNQVIDLGEPIKAGMTAAEDVARRALSPGEIREIRRRYTLDWDGWALAPPRLREP